MSRWVVTVLAVSCHLALGMRVQDSTRTAREAFDLGDAQDMLLSMESDLGEGKGEGGGDELGLPVFSFTDLPANPPLHINPQPAIRVARRASASARTAITAQRAPRAGCWTPNKTRRAVYS